MLDALSFAADLALFFATVFVVGKRPTAFKVAGLICVVAAVQYGFVVLAASQMHVNPIEWYRQALTEALALYGGQAAGYESLVAVVAGISPAIYMVQAAAYVFVGLGIRWIANRVSRKSEWSPFSRVDLSIWWTMPLLLGIACYVVSLFVRGQASHDAWLVSLNLLVVSCIPLFVQGAAVGKSVMDRMHIAFAWQMCICVVGIFSGLALVGCPVVGLVDFWANFRRLPRDDSSQGGVSAK